MSSVYCHPRRGRPVKPCRDEHHAREKLIGLRFRQNYRIACEWWRLKRLLEVVNPNHPLLAELVIPR